MGVLRTLLHITVCVVAGRSVRNTPLPFERPDPPTPAKCTAAKMLMDEGEFVRAVDKVVKQNPSLLENVGYNTGKGTALAVLRWVDDAVATCFGYARYYLLELAQGNFGPVFQRLCALLALRDISELVWNSNAAELFEMIYTHFRGGEDDYHAARSSRFVITAAAAYALWPACLSFARLRSVGLTNSVVVQQVARVTKVELQRFRDARADGEAPRWQGCGVQ